MATSPFGGFSPFLRDNSSTLLNAGIGLLSGRNPNEQAAMGLQGLQQGLQQNKTAQWLSKNAPPEIAQAVQAGVLTPGEAYKTVLESRTKRPGNLLTVGKNLYNSETGDWISPPAGVGGEDQEYGLNPQYGVDANGNPVILQLSKGGTSKQTALPDGVTLSKEPIRLDAGTHFVLLDPITRQPIGQIPKNVAEVQRQQELGTAQGKAESSAPGDLQAGQNALTLIDSIRNDPYKERGTGFSSFGNSIRGTGGYDFQNKVEQAKSGAFLTAIQQMRGLGALSNTEGQAATAAVTRMNTSTSMEEFDAALNDYETIVRQGIAKAQGRMAGGSPSSGASPTGNRTSSGVQWSVEP